MLEIFRGVDIHDLAVASRFDPSRLATARKPDDIFCFVTLGPSALRTGHILSGTIENIAPGSRISLKLEDGRKIEFDATGLAHFDHGYAATSYSAQGLTADRVLINADTTAHPELLNARFAYVSVSRARIDAEIYTNNAEGLGSRLSADLSKSSALEFSEPVGVSTARDFGMGQSI